MQNRKRLAFALRCWLADRCDFTEASHFQPWNSVWAALIPFACPSNFLLGWVLFDANPTLSDLGTPDSLEHSDLFRDRRTVGKALLSGELQD